MVDTSLTEEQKAFLEECENEFKDRYGENDYAFMKIKNMELRKPPIIDPWYNKPRRTGYDWSQNQGRRNNAWDRRNNDRGERMDKRGDRNQSYRHM